MTQTANPRTNPFLIYRPIDDPDSQDKPHEYENPLRVFYEEIAPPLFPRPKATRTPEAPVRTVGWDPSQGMKGARTSTFVPLPLPGTTPVTEGMARVAKGTEGMNTMINLIVDTSGSMSSTAATLNGYSYGRWEVARICAAIMIEMAKRGDDYFGMFSFSNRGKTEWPAPALDHDDCIDWMLSYYPGGTAGMGIQVPFSPGGGTDIPSGMRECIRAMKTKKMDKAVTVIICDMYSYDGSYFYNAAMASDGFGGTCDATLRKYGPVFYIAIGSESESDNMDAAQEAFSVLMDGVVGHKIFPRPGISCALGEGLGGAITLGGTLARIAGMV